MHKGQAPRVWRIKPFISFCRTLDFLPTMSYRGQSHGYNRPRQNFRGGYHQYSRSTGASVTAGGRDLYEGLHKDAISTLAKPASEESDGNDSIIAIENLEYLASYNWVEAKKPTVIVPGSPVEWTDRPLPFQVSLDDGTNFIDQNAYRTKNLALVPLVQVVEAINVDEDKPNFDWSSVDFVTDRNGLRKLLRWATDTPGKPARDFRIDTQLAGEKTVLFNRWEKSNRDEPGSASRNPSYGFNFERASTTPALGCKDGTGHHRIVTYDFDGLKMVVRFEVDACLPSNTNSKPKKTISSSSTRVAGSGDGEDLANMLSNLAIGSTGAAAAATPTTTATSSSSTKEPIDLNIIWAGVKVPQSSIIELTTRSEQSVANFDWAEAYPQLYLSQTPLHYLAVHKRGRFAQVTKRRSDQGDFIRIEKQVMSGFRKLRRALEVVHDLVVNKHGLEGRIVSLVCTDGVLKVYERSAGGDGFLPDQLLALFSRKD